MTYEEKIYTPATEKVVKHDVALCLICGNEKVKIDEYDDQYGYISTATCQNCGQEVKENTTAAGIIKSWNERNDIDTLLTNKAKLIERTKNEILALKDLQKQRRKGLAKGIA